MSLLKIFRQKVKADLTTTTEMFDELALKAAPKKFVPIKSVFTDGFSITDPILNLSEFVRFLREECGINIYSSKRTWQCKATKDQPKRFFIRIDDKSAVIT